METIRKWSMSAAAATLAFGAACSTAPPKSPEQAQADQITADWVYAALNDDPVFFFRHVDVSADNGVVTLGGYVWTTDSMLRAKRIARSVPGVTTVVNQMELERQAVNGGGGGRGP